MIKINVISISKIYLFILGLTNVNHLTTLLGVSETIVIAPFYLNDRWWSLILVLLYMVFPIIVILLNNYFLFVFLSGISIVRIFFEVCGILTWVPGPYLILPLYIIASALSLLLAIENVGSRASGEILKLMWSQY